MIDVNYAGGLMCNKMTQYAILRSVAYKHKKNIKSDFEWLFKDPEIYNYRATLGSLRPYTIINNDNLKEILSGKHEEDACFTTTGCENSYFQTEAGASCIRENLPNITKDSQPPIDGIFVHYRLGDISSDSGPDSFSVLQGGAQLLIKSTEKTRAVKVAYMEKAVENIPGYNSLERYISSDSPQDPRVQHIISKYGFKLWSGGPEETILFGSRFTNKVLSKGTFSWWIGVLGSQNNVSYPDRSKCVPWHGSIFVFDDWNPTSSRSRFS